MPTIEESPVQARDILMQPAAGIDLPAYESMNTIHYGEVRFAFNPFAGHPLADDVHARQQFCRELWLACQRRKCGERVCPWTLRHEKSLIILFDWAGKERQQCPDRYDDDGDFYARIREMFCRIVNKSPTEAPPFEPALALERDRDDEEQRVLRDHRVNCSRGGFRRTIAEWLEVWGFKESLPPPEIGHEWDYRRFCAHNGQMVELVRWFSEHRQEIEREYGNPSITVPCRS